MRGHWLSETRKLNKHYQDGEQITPPFLTLGYFKMGGGFCPTFKHYRNGNVTPAYPSGQNEYYNVINNVVNINNNNFAIGRTFYGYRNVGSKCYVDGYFYDPVFTGLPQSGIDAAYAKVAELEADHTLSSRVDPEESNVYHDMGIRFSSFHYPKKFYGPPYISYKAEPDYGLSVYMYDTKFLVNSGLIMSPDGVRNQIWYRDGGHVSFVNYTFLIAREENGQMVQQITGVRPVGIYNEQYLNLYSQSVNGQSYLVVSPVKILVNGDELSCYGRIYCFIYNGVYYIDQMVHPGYYDVDNNWVPVEPDEPVFLYSFNYPVHGLGGYCMADPYVCPMTTYYAENPNDYGRYPSSYYDGNSDATAQLIGNGMHKTFLFRYYDSGTPYDRSLNAIHDNMTPPSSLYHTWMDKETEQKFWDMEEAYHELYGGVSYREEFPNGEYGNT